MVQSSDVPEVARLLEVRTVEVISGRGRSITLSSVRCPVRRRSAATEECGHCARSEGLARDALARGEWLACRCGLPAAAGEPPEAPRVVDAMRATAIALRPGVARQTAADALRASGQPLAPVVDGEGRPVGVVGEAELLRSRPGAKVSEVMARGTLAVQETAPLVRAAALMAAHRMERIAVVSADGAVVGVLSALDVVAWATAAGGPLAPAQRAEEIG